MNAPSSWAVVAVLCSASASFAEAPPVKAALLDDLSIVEGTFEEFNGVIRITPATGSARLLTPKQITLVADSRDKVYEVVAGKVDTSSTDGAKKLAGWCEKVGMTDRGLAHAKAAAALAPNDAAVREMVARLEKAAAAKPRVEAKATSAKLPTPPGPTPAPELPADAAIAFTAKVQPILLNQCASCHAAKSYVGAFKLTRIPEGYASPETNTANLKATAGQLDRTAPAKSPLLTYAVTAHGGQKAAAFADRQRPAFQHLESWVLGLLPQAASRGFGAPTVAARPMPDADPTGLPGTIVGTTGQPIAAKPLAPPAAPSPPVALPPTVAASPPVAQPPATRSADPFDPDRFNGLPKKPEK